MKVPRPDSLNDDINNAQGITKHPFGEPYSHGPEHHPDGAVDPELPGRGTIDFSEPGSEMAIVRHKEKVPKSNTEGFVPTTVPSPIE